MFPEESEQQIDVHTERETFSLEPFRQILVRHDLKLEREQTTSLQVNIGLLCNQTCKHCHLRAGPDRKENMDRETAENIVSYAQRSDFEIIDITGGAPELNPILPDLIERLSPLTKRLVVRSNLSALNDGKRDHLFHILQENSVVITASFPSFNEAQTDSQRGERVFHKSIHALKKLNAMGYGCDDSGLELNLVVNPTGAFLPPSQPQTEKRFRQVLEKKWGITFNNVFTFANIPLGRFRDWLVDSHNLQKYMERLVSSFNPCAVEKVMCRTMVSVAWDGYLFDCDFHLARGLHLGGRKIHVTEMTGPPEAGSPIATADYCYTCTAGAGFT